VAWRLATRLGSVIVSTAEPHDALTVAAILEEAAAWQAARGIDQWRPGSFTPALLAPRLAAGEVYLARLGADAVGTLTLQWSDAPIWGAQPPTAGYVHRLAVRRRAAGTGLAPALLAWAGEQVAARGRTLLRLDCPAANPALCRYYERLGFRPAGEVAGAGWRAARFERPVEP
jgi:GNAT superfamily N-acetyltransferase